VHVRGTVAGEVDVRSVSTSYGESELAEVPLRPAEDASNGEATDDDETPRPQGDGGTVTVADGRETRTVTLWNKWTESAELLEPGMELLVTNAKEEEYNGEMQYATTGGSYVVVEPSFLVSVTSIRNWVQCPRLYYLNKLSGVPLNYPRREGDARPRGLRRPAPRARPRGVDRCPRRGTGAPARLAR